MVQNSIHMTISELSGRSNVPVSTIKYYIRENLMPGPRKTKGTRAYYNFFHLDRLMLIKKIKTEGNISLDKVKEIIGMIEDGERRKQENSMENQEIKAEIIISAISAFREKGYEKITIADLVDAAQIGRSTFYKHFKNKKDLFIECIKKIIFTEMQKTEKHEIPDDEILEVFDKHAKAYYNANPIWHDMVNQLRAAAINDPEEFADKLDEVIHLKIDLLKRGLENGIRTGLFRNINATLMAVMILGLQDYNDYLLKELGEPDFEKLYDEGTDIILYGILKK